MITNLICMAAGMIAGACFRWLWGRVRRKNKINHVIKSYSYLPFHSHFPTPGGHWPENQQPNPNPPKQADRKLRETGEEGP